MNLLDLLFSPKGTIKPQPFALVVIGIYALNLIAGSVLDGQFVMRAGLWPYVALQLLLTWIWFAVHKKRLADAGKGYAVAASLAFIYLVGVAIFASLTVASAPAVLDKVDPADPKVSLFGAIIAIAFIYTLFSGDFFLIAFLIFLLIGLPFVFALIVVIYSIVTGARASLTSEPPAAVPSPPQMPEPEPATPLPGIEKLRSPFS
jgi:hypothetical protein